MKADTSPAISNTSSKSARGTAVKEKTSGLKEPLLGNGPWIRVDGAWYTKDAAGEIVPMKG